MTDYAYSEGADTVADAQTQTWSYHRIAPFAVGLLLSFFMHRPESKIKMNKVSTVISTLNLVSLHLNMLIVQSCIFVYLLYNHSSLYDYCTIMHLCILIVQSCIFVYLLYNHASEYAYCTIMHLCMLIVQSCIFVYLLYNHSSLYNYCTTMHLCILIVQSCIFV